MNNYKIIAMIPARMGSTRIPKKNIRILGNKPLMQYPIDLCMMCDRFESIWFNSESEELGRIAEKMGVNFHKRPDELSSNKATNRDFVYEFLKAHECDYVVMVNTTSPLLSLNTLNNFIDFISEHDFDTVLSVVNEKTECFFKNEPINFPLSEKINSQYLEPVARTVWAMTAWKRDTFIRLQESGSNPVFGGKLGLFSVPKDESCDLDTEEDWNIAEGMILSKERKPSPRYYL
ncbi:MAG TPA: acylneuraminate cytidylyltransferase family protein [Bacillales bacterium]|jgi:CMP-N-acetylneuraminic acid synthetase|nr:acylneuraminate cytidylyltransferase family protein [Bacillales bacterium]